MSQRAYERVVRIWQSTERQFSIEWTDGLTQAFDVVHLRRMCPCAYCVDEATGVRTANPQDVSDDVRPQSIESVGRYGLKITFTDGHDTGIYSFSYLRDLADSA